MKNIPLQAEPLLRVCGGKVKSKCGMYKKIKIRDLETQIDQIDKQIEERVRGLYGVGS